MSEAELRATVERYFTALSTRNIERLDPLYAADAKGVFFGMSGSPALGRAAYRDEQARLLATFRGLDVTTVGEIQIRRTGSHAWTAVTFRGTAALAKGGSVQIDGRQTAVWERARGEWVMAHEHVSLPVPDPARLTAWFPPDASDAADRQAIAELFQAIRGLLERRQRRWFVGALERGGDVVTLSGIVARNRDAIARMWQNAMSRRAATTTPTQLDAAVERIAFIRPGVALVDGLFNYRQGAAAVPAAQERFSAVLTTDDGRWQIDATRVAAVPAPPPPPERRRR